MRITPSWTTSTTSSGQRRFVIGPYDGPRIQFFRPLERTGSHPERVQATPKPPKTPPAPAEGATLKTPDSYKGRSLCGTEGKPRAEGRWLFSEPPSFGITRPHPCRKGSVSTT